MPVYCDSISERLGKLCRSGRASGANAVGTGASFQCGSFVRFSLRIDPATKRIAEACFSSNGCGFMVAAADLLADELEGRSLTDLDGLARAGLLEPVWSQFGAYPASRVECAATCLDALAAALGDFRAFQLEEYRGETALVCTCFGVSEETIERTIAEQGADTVEEVTRLCNAGRGCGSCQMLIAEMIDGR